MIRNPKRSVIDMYLASSKKGLTSFLYFTRLCQKNEKGIPKSLKEFSVEDIFNC